MRNCRSGLVKTDKSLSQKSRLDKNISLRNIFISFSFTSQLLLYLIIIFSHVYATSVSRVLKNKNKKQNVSRWTQLISLIMECVVVHHQNSVGRRMIYLSIYVYIHICVCVYMYIQLWTITIFINISPFLCFFIYRSVKQFFKQHFIFLSVYLSISTNVSLSLFLSVYL